MSTDDLYEMHMVGWFPIPGGRLMVTCSHGECGHLEVIEPSAEGAWQREKAQQVCLAHRIDYPNGKRSA